MVSPGFAVETATRSYLLPLDAIVELCDALPLAPSGEPHPLIAGTARYREETLPVIALDVLLGEAPREPRPPWGGFVVIAAGGRRCILAVARVGRLVGIAAPEAPLDLAARLTAILAPAEIVEARPP